jgi:aspartyl-tRNA(Asn)/glutamyl-tRNA(Gln) amidotransferase subunit A
MPDIDDILTITEAAEAISSRELSVVELTESLLNRIEDWQSTLNAFITVTADHALDQAQAADAEISAGNYRGPLHGIPFGLKDIYETAQILTTAHSKILEENVPDEDCAPADCLYKAGAILLGKLSTHEFAHGGPAFDLPWPPARNPWNPAHFTGGSSSGSGAAVAAGLVLGAMGSDTGGSVRNPASLCGTVGLKPTYGLISRHGVIPNSYTFDTCGPLTWTVKDSALMLQALVGHDPRDAGSVNCAVPDYSAALNDDIQGLHVGVVRHFWEEDLPANDEVKAAMETALTVLGDLGAVQEEVRLRPMQDYCDVKIVIAESELFALHHQDFMTRPGDFCAEFLGRSLPAVLFSGSDYVHAQRERRIMLDEMKKVFEYFDVLVTPSQYGPAPLLNGLNTASSFWKNPTIATPFNVAAGPSISVCMGFSESGLPLGLQISGSPFDDARVMQVAHAYEQATPWRDTRPTLEAAQSVEIQAVPPILAQPTEPCDPKIADEVRKMVALHGLSLSEEHLALIDGAAPFAKSRAERLRSKRHYGADLSSTFRF